MDGPNLAGIVTEALGANNGRPGYDRSPACMVSIAPAGSALPQSAPSSNPAREDGDPGNEEESCCAKARR
jgi:hypothetical protein